MNLIVSTKLENNYTNYKVIKSFKDVLETDEIDTLIINSFDESNFDAGVFIAKIHKQGVNKFVYISQEPDMTVKMVIQGLKGYIFEDEFYLEDEEELDCLLADIGMSNEESTSLASASVGVIKDFVHAFARGEERIKVPAYLEQVSQAVNELSVLTQKQELQIRVMGTSAIEIFEKASLIIKTMVEQHKDMEQKLVELEESQNIAASSRATFSSNITFFTPFKYMGNAKILVIREVSPCRYLTSFVLGYLHHLHYDMNKRAKLIFAHQKGAGVSAKYNDYTLITQETASMSSLYEAEVIATNNPKREVMKDLLAKKSEVFVVVDRLYQNQSIVQGRISELYAVSGATDLDRFKLQPEDCIFPVSGTENAFFTIPTIKGYVTEVDARQAAYSQICGDAYNRLDILIKLIRSEE